MHTSRDAPEWGIERSNTFLIGNAVNVHVAQMCCIIILCISERLVRLLSLKCHDNKQVYVRASLCVHSDLTMSSASNNTQRHSAKKTFRISRNKSANTMHLSMGFIIITCQLKVAVNCRWHHPTSRRCYSNQSASMAIGRVEINESKQTYVRRWKNAVSCAPPKSRVLTIEFMRSIFHALPYCHLSITSMYHIFREKHNPHFIASIASFALNQIVIIILHPSNSI